MKLEWTLDELFKNDEKLFNEIANVKKLIRNITKYKNKNLNAKSLYNLLNKKWEIKELTNNVLVYGSLRYYKNIKDETCIKLKTKVEKFKNYVDSKLSFIDLKIIELGQEKINNYILENPKLNTYKHSIDNLFRLRSHLQSEETNNIIKNNLNIINSNLTTYNTLVKDTKYQNIIIDGKETELNAININKFLASKNRETRKDAYFSLNEAFKAQNNKFASILNTILGKRIENAKLENYNNIIEKVLFEENINAKIIDTLIKSVNDNLPLIQRYLNLKAKTLKIEDPHLYDFSVPIIANVAPKYTIKEAISIIKKALKPLGRDYLKVVNKLLKNHIDATPNEEKHQAITFSWHTYSFLNFRGNYIDLKNLIHELGHIVNYYLSKENLPFIYEDSTIFVGEVASTTNEILLNKYLYNNSKNDKEKIFYLSKEIESYFTLLYKQTMYTEYEQILYKIRKNTDLTSEILSNNYEKLIKKYYGQDITYDDISSTEWARLGHTYRYSYYTYKYATALIMASIVVNNLVNDKTLTKKQYLKFLAAGSSNYSLDLLKLLDIDLTNSNTINNGFKVLENDINELESLLNQNN